MMNDFDSKKDNQMNTQPEQNHAEYSWQGDYYHSYRQPVYPTPEAAAPPKKKKGFWKGLLIALAVVLACGLVSAATLGTFVSLINNGTLALTNTGTEAAPAYTITKLIDSAQEKTDEAAPAGTASRLAVKDIASKVLPSIVCIQNFQATSANDMFSFFSQPQNSDLSPAGEGSGIIASEDGYILTNAHVVSGADSLKVVTYDGTTYEATLVGSDTATDLAVVKVEADGLKAAEFGSSGDLSVGDQVVAVGNPGGLEFGFSTTVGYVSALNRAITNTSGYTMDFIQTDAATNPGNSGGALVNEYGQVVGIVSAKIVSEAYEGLGFAIPIDEAQSVISNLKDYGYVRDRAVLGVSGTYVDSFTARFYGVSTGWYISEITNDSLTKAGIKAGDVITAVNGTAVTGSETIAGMMMDMKPGDKVTLSIYRSTDDSTFDAEVTLAEYQGK